jgi:adenylylsulfate kinase-like enzyme
VTAPVPVLLLTGTVGSGKTTLAYEVNDLLSEREVPNATIENGDRPIRAVAEELLTRTGWI